MLTRIAGAVADGEAVDWDSAEHVLPESQRVVARALRAIAESTGGSSRGTSASDRTPQALRAVPWLWPILGLGAGHVVLGLAGFLLGARDVDLSPRTWALAAMLVFGGATMWLAWGGSRDPRALWLAGVFVTVASAFAFGPAAELSASRVGRWVSRPWANAMLVEGYLPLCLWCFVRAFPRVLHLERTERVIRAAIMVTAAAGVVLFLLNLGVALGALGLVESPRHWNAGRLGAVPLAYWGVIIGLALPALPLSFLRARSAAPSERRRVRRFALGLALGLGPLFLEVLAEAVIPPFRRLMDSPSASLLGSLILFPPLLSIPFVTAHAVVADRLLDVRPLLGRAARYLLARTTLLVLMTLPLLTLAVYLYERRADSLANLVSGPEGLLLLSTTGAGFLLLASRERLTRRLDLMFDRSQADWSRLRLRAGQLIRHGPTAREAAANLLVELARELQIDAAALLVAARDRRWFVPLAGQARPLRGDSALHALAAAEPSPLSTDPGDPQSVFTLLPAEDQRWVLDTQTALLVPLAASDGKSAGLLALNAKRNEALFTEDERWELSGLCDAVALALENRGLHEALQPASPRTEEEELPATECPRCRRVHKTEQERCACGTPVVVAPLPRILLGKLELRERLGEGGMGLVYRAFDRELERSVAVKTLPRASEEATQRLRQEARAMAAVSHPGVAIIYAVESWQGLPFLVVEHLAGGTLARRLGSPWPAEEALRLGVDLADALDAIHRRGLLHRDVKPSNIGFDGEAHPKLLDFGLAQLVQPLGEIPEDGRGFGERPLVGLGESASTWSRGLAGTPLYLSPEVLAGGAPGPSQDLWGLTLVLFELIAGVHPFRAHALEQTLDRARHARVGDLRRWAPACPEPVALLFARALHQDARERPASAAALQSELRGLLTSRN
ncbi:MAG TPA: protein kinase [Vicinamibacteria bacterium]|nr:protein kinase [Vicinamibacteria bacterium]